MNTSRLSSPLAAVLGMAGLTVPLFAKGGGICDGGAPTCEIGAPIQLPAVSDEFNSISSPADVSLIVPKYDGSQGDLVGVVVSFEFIVDGVVTYTNDTTQTCTGHSWLNSTIIDPVDTDDAPTCPAFPIDVPAFENTGNFPPTAPNGGSQTVIIPPDGFCNSCSEGPEFVAGPFTDAANLAAFTGPGTIEFTTRYQTTTNCIDQCNPGDCEFDHTFFARVEVIYYVCVEVPPPSGCECLGPSPHYRMPGSLLLYPEFDNLDGDVTVVTVTNVDCTGQSEDTIVEFKYIDHESCEEFNREETLTPCDTLTLLTNVHNPEDEQGYLYVFAKDERGNPIVSNHLIGNLMVISGFEAFDYSINPVAFLGIGSNSGIVQPQGTQTDLDGDGILDLDNAEYQPAPEVITIPRFLGQDEDQGPGLFQSQLILIGLSGGSQFDTTIDCLLYNDNEQAFSFDHTFYCWEKSRLRDITFAFSNDFLSGLGDGNDPDEIVGAPTRESGWLCCDGAVASSTTETINDPAFYMVLVERVGDYGVADLPFECGFQTNGALLPRDNNGDGDPNPVPGDDK
jgi:hypothetical protein